MQFQQSLNAFLSPVGLQVLLQSELSLKRPAAEVLERLAIASHPRRLNDPPDPWRPFELKSVFFLEWSQEYSRPL
jgi:hypothetical protein